MMKKETWVVVANSSHARFFRLDGLKMTELDSLIHPEAHLTEKDLVTDKPGRTDSPFSKGRSVYEPHHSAKEMGNQQFVKKISEVLDSARTKGSLGKIYIAASPHILGLLRSEMDSHTQAMIASELDKDISGLKADEILKYFPVGL